MSNKHRPKIQRKRAEADVTIHPPDSAQARRMLAVLESILDTGTYPCPECGALVECVGYDADLDSLHFICPTPSCRYEGWWGI